MKFRCIWSGLCLSLCLWTAVAPAVSNVLMMGCRLGVGSDLASIEKALKGVPWRTVLKGILEIRFGAVLESYSVSDAALTGAGGLGVALLTSGLHAGHRLGRFRVVFFGLQPLMFSGTLGGVLLLPTLPLDLISPRMMWFEENSVFLISGASWVIGSIVLCFVSLKDTRDIGRS